MADLSSWAETYLRHRDLFEHKIASFAAAREGFLITEKNGNSYPCLVAELLDDATLERAEKAKRATIVTRNARESLAFLTRHWKRFAAVPQLKIIFANTQHNEKWILMPAQHDRIAEPESLALGLQAMFESISEG